MVPSSAKTPMPPRGFEKSRKTMAMILHALLTEAGYDVGYLSTPGADSRTLTIGTWGANKMAVCNQKPPRRYAEAKADTERFVRLVNIRFGAVTGAASSLASYNFESGTLGAGPWHSIIVQVPGMLTLRKLHSHFVK